MRGTFLSVLILVAAGGPALAKPAQDQVVLLTENDITDRPYRVLQDLKVTVRKQTLFSPEPTREKVAEKLRRKAAALGTDAVILIRYGTVGMGIIGWGELEGRGRAIKFE